MTFLRASRAIAAVVVIQRSFPDGLGQYFEGNQVARIIRVHMTIAANSCARSKSDEILLVLLVLFCPQEYYISLHVFDDHCIDLRQ